MGLNYEPALLDSGHLVRARHHILQKLHHNREPSVQLGHTRNRVMQDGGAPLHEPAPSTEAGGPGLGMLPRVGRPRYELV